MVSKFLKLFMILFMIALVSTACKGPGSETPTTQAPSTATVVPATPTTQPQLVVYVTGQAGANAAISDVLAKFATANGLQMETAASLDAAGLDPNTKIVVWQDAATSLDNLLASAPQVQFILLGSGDAAGKANLSVITTKPEEIAFMAGYLSTLIAYDWRSAALVASDGPLAGSEADAFLNGGKYVCGKCNPTYPPMVALPQVSSLPINSDAAAWVAAANELIPNGVNVVYLDEAAAKPEVINAFTDIKVALISTIQPPQGTSDYWAATISSDAASILKDLLPKVLAGQSGQNLIAPLQLSDINPDLVSPARQDLFNQTAEMLAQGKIGALSIP